MLSSIVFAIISREFSRSSLGVPSSIIMNRVVGEEEESFEQEVEVKL